MVKRTKLLFLKFILMLTGFSVIVTFQNCAKIQATDIASKQSGLGDPGNGGLSTVVQCDFEGAKVEIGSKFTRNQNSSVPYGSKCVSEVRVCNPDGTMSGSYTYPQCAIGEPKSCQFDGKTYQHGESITAYQNSSVAYGQKCNSEKRTCDNGQWSGSYNHPKCDEGLPKACTFDGKTVAHGATVKAARESSVPYGNKCSYEDRKCDNGNLSGSYTYASCNEGAPRACMFDGKTIAHGQTVEASRESSVPYGEKCVSETRKCTDGNLSGSYNYPSCEVGGAKSCKFDGKTIAHGETVKASRESAVPYGSKCVSEDRKCENGQLSGSYMYPSCNEGTPKACLFDGKTIAHGQTVEASRESSVPYGQKCVSEERQCIDGTLSGSYAYSTCEVGKARSCKFDGRTIAHGETVMASREASVPYGERCLTEERMCVDGTLSGSYMNPSCKVEDQKCDPGYELKNKICVKIEDGDDDKSDHKSNHDRKPPEKDEDQDKHDDKSDHSDHKSEHKEDVKHETKPPVKEDDKDKHDDKSDHSDHKSEHKEEIKHDSKPPVKVEHRKPAAKSDDDKDDDESEHKEDVDHKSKPTVKVDTKKEDCKKEPVKAKTEAQAELKKVVKETAKPAVKVVAKKSTKKDSETEPHFEF